MVRAIRGAVTVKENDAGEILDMTETLLKEIIRANELEQEDVASVVFTVTKDLNAAFPAAAARRLGWNEVALMCMNEIDVPSSLEKCIRVMVHVNTDKRNNQMKHIFLNGAVILRPDLAAQSK